MDTSEMESQGHMIWNFLNRMLSVPQKMSCTMGKTEEETEMCHGQ